VARQLLSRNTGWSAGLTEEAFQAGGRYDPEQEQFLIGIGEPVPGVLWDVDRSALLKPVRCVIQDKRSAAFQDVEGFVHLEVSVDRNACTNRHLLRPQRQATGAGCGINLDEDVAGIPEVNEMFAAIRTEYVSLCRRGLSRSLPLQQRVADAETCQAK